MNKLFLYSLLKDSIFDDALQASIFEKFDIKPDEYDPRIDAAEAFVFFNETAQATSVHSVLKKAAIGASEEAINFYFPSHPLTIEQAVFPNKDENNNFELFNRYENAVKSILTQNSSLSDFATKLFYLQRFYLSSEPNNRNLATVSLFEFLKSRAAFAQCLATPDVHPSKPFLLFCGDLSGIQGFIYDIHSSRAYKSIKGRSFYLQLVVESLIAKILENAQMPPCNIVYSSGGKFFLLLPNAPHIEFFLSKIQSKLEKTLFDRFQLGLYVCIDWIKFNINSEDYKIETAESQKDGSAITGIGDLWQAVSEKCAAKKARKFESVLIHKFDELFNGNFKENFNGVGMSICAVSGVPVRELDANRIDDKASGEEPVYVHPSVREQIALGEKLRDSNYVGLIKDSFQNLDKKQWINPLDLGYFVNLLQKPIANIQIQYLNPPTENDYLQFVETFNATQFLFYGGNRQAETETFSIKTLEELAEPQMGKSMRKIAIVRMDVDNLGHVFTGKRIPNIEYQTFAAMSDLSMRLDWFFSGYLNSVRNSESFKDTVNILYAGGDDLCAVGRWDKILEFTIKVRNDFAKYVGMEEGLTISAGYALFSPKFPIARAIKEAGSALDEAKKFKQAPTNPIADKNAIHLLSTTIGWGEEWTFVQQLKTQFSDWLQDGTMSKGMIYKLFVFKDMKDRGVLDWYWQSAYYFAKMKKPVLEGVKKAILTNEYGTFRSLRMFDMIILAAKWADYETR